MYVEWTKHIPDEKEKEQFENSVYGAKRVLDRLKAILDEKEKSIDRTETDIAVYNTPSWDYRQAHKNGNRETLGWLKKLVDLDQQKLPKETNG